jgi:RND family efflux transporter MFP subunit
MAKVRKTLGVILAVAVIAVGIYFIFFNRGPAGAKNQTGDAAAPAASRSSSGAGGSAPDAADSNQKTEAAPLPVKTVLAAKGDLVMTLKSPGEAYTEKKIVLKAEVGGVVKNLYASEGRHVKNGDHLVELDEREYRLKLDRLEAQRLKALSELYLEKQFAANEKEIPPAALEKLKKAQADYDRASEAFHKGQIASPELEQSQKDLEMALIEAGRKKDEIMASSKNLTQCEIDVKLARMDLDKTIIRAPFDGIVTDLKISPNERLDAGRELFTLVDIGRIKVKAKVLESEIGKMKAGREVDLRFSAYPGKIFKGVVEAVSPVVNAEDRTCSVHIAVNNPSEELKPGMHAEVEIAADVYKDRLLVPQEAVLVRGGRKLVFVVENGLAKWRYIEIGMENEHFAEVLTSTEPGWGVQAGEQVIVEGHFTLAHDAKVVVKN